MDQKKNETSVKKTAAICSPVPTGAVWEGETCPSPSLLAAAMTAPTVDGTSHHKTWNEK